VADPITTAIKSRTSQETGVEDVTEPDGVGFHAQHHIDLATRLNELSEVDNTADADKPVSTAQAAADAAVAAASIPLTQKAAASGVATLDSGTKIPAAQLPALTKSDVGLGNVDNTTDAAKPISDATATALAALSGSSIAPWQTGVALGVGAVVSFGAGVYRTTTAHTPGALFDANNFSILIPTSILEGVDLLVLGHSYPAGYIASTLQSVVTFGYGSRVARQLGMNLTSWAVSGRRLPYVFAGAMDAQYQTGAPIATTRSGVVIIDVVKNDESGTSAARKASWKNLLKNLTYFIQEDARVDDTAASVTLSGTWTAQTGNPNGLIMLGTNFRKTTTLNDYVEVAFTGTGVNLWIGAFYASLKTGGDVKVTVDGVDTTTFSTAGLYDGTSDSLVRGYHAHCVPIRGLSSGAHTVRLTNMTASAEFYYDHWAVPAVNPTLVCYIREPQSTPPASGTAATADAYNVLIDQVVAEFASGRVISADCRTDFDPATMMQPDGNHPNQKGQIFMTEKIVQALTNAMQEQYLLGIHAR